MPPSGSKKNTSPGICCSYCIYKAASILGLGRESVIDVGDQTQPWALDWDKLKRALGDGVAGSDTVSIVVIGAGEVNTGRYAISGEHMQQLRKMADVVGAWIHVDGGKCFCFLDSPKFHIRWPTCFG
jgi:glutamate/tyrosine decarboxylase-like PLP-dependent enzyme